MERIARGIVKHRKAIMIIFIVFAAVCIFLQSFVKVNYNMTDYLPPEAQSTQALIVMNNEFTAAMPNTSVMIKDIEIPLAQEMKQKLLSLKGVTQVMWLDDMVNINQPLEMGDSDTIEGFYNDNNALYSVTIAKGMEKETTLAIQELIGEDNAVAGEAPDIAFMQNGSVTEVMGALAILLPIILLLLFISTSSWLEPILFLGAIGISILINMGTNIFAGEVSFMTNSVAPILQLAVSLDYAIFLLHSFAVNKKRYGSAEEGMVHAIINSMSTVAASACTTLFGFLALVFMDFQIGADLGIALAKGIVFSFLSCMIFLPALTLTLQKAIEKTAHREIMPDFLNAHRYLSKLAIPAIAIVLVLIVPCFLGQSKTAFIYGNGTTDVSNRIGRDTVMIDEAFGSPTVMAILVPRGDIVQEKALCDEVKSLNEVTGVMSYANSVGTAIPPEYLGSDITEQFYSDNYSRIILYMDTPSEGDLAFQTVENIQEIIKKYYPEGAYSLGQSANLYDMKNVVEKDNTVVNLIAIIAIFAVLLINFKSALLPLILLITIEAGIWINLAIPYFTGISINYIGYLIINTVQLGATVDYAILLTTHYIRNRKELPKKDAIYKSLGATFKSILISGTTLATAGFTLFITSSNASISDLGLLLCRGTIMSMAMVLCFLPAVLTLLDKPIGKLTYRANFMNKRGLK